MNSHQHCALNQNDVIVCYFVAEKMYDVIFSQQTQNQLACRMSTLLFSMHSMNGDCSFSNPAMLKCEE